MRLFVLYFLIIPALLFAGSDHGKLRNKIHSSTGDEKINAIYDYVNEIYLDSSEVALPFALQAVELSSEEAGSLLNYRCMNILVLVYQDIGKLDSAYAVARRGYELSKRLKSEQGQSYFLADFGALDRFNGKYDTAIESFIKAIELAEKGKDSIHLTFLYNVIGITLFDVKDYNRSISYLKHGLLISERLKSETRLTEYYLNLGSSYSEANKVDSALYFWHKCQALAEKNDYHDMLSAAYNNIAGFHFSRGEYEKTLEYGLKSLAIAEKYHDKQSSILYNVNIGALYAELGKHDKAHFHLDKGIALARSYGYKKLLADGYQGKAEAYELVNDYKRSLEYHKMWKDLQDSLFNLESNKQISELNAKYETEKNQQKIQLLSKESALHQSEASRQKTMRNSMLGVSLMIAGMGLVAFRGYRQKKKANALLTEQKNEIEFHREQLSEKNKDITDSINYGRRIQSALLQSPAVLLHDKEHFLLFKPRDIVSGDFYWISEQNKLKVIAIADCTGHGVPGAFMSMIGISLLNDLVKVRKMTDPGQILDALRVGIINALNSEGSEVKDGMDISLVVLDEQNQKLLFAGANNSGILLRRAGADLIQITLTADKMPVGPHSLQKKSFTSQSFDILPGDLLYLTTDGYADQFGGPQGKKLRSKQLKELILSVADESMDHQGKFLDEKFSEWKGDLEQVDDVCVFGMRF